MKTALAALPRRGWIREAPRVDRTCDSAGILWAKLSHVLPFIEPIFDGELGNSVERSDMEKQYVMILFLVLGLLVVSQRVCFTAESAPDSETVRYKLARAARTFLGLPYRWGGMSERRGADCSGLVKMIFAKLHIDLPRTSRDQIQSGEEVSVDKLETGDLVFFPWMVTLLCMSVSIWAIINSCMPRKRPGE